MKLKSSPFGGSRKDLRGIIMIFQMSGEVLKWPGRRLGLTIVLILAISASGVSGVCQAATQTKIFFASNRDASGITGIYSISPGAADSTAVQLVKDASQPALSPDGSLLAFVRDDYILIGRLTIESNVVVLRGLNGSTAPTPLTSGSGDRIDSDFDGQPAFSPDGKEISFQRVVFPINHKVFLIKSDASETTLRTVNSGRESTNDTSPAVASSTTSTSKAKVVFARERIIYGPQLLRQLASTVVGSRNVVVEESANNVAGTINRVTVSPTTGQAVFSSSTATSTTPGLYLDPLNGVDGNATPIPNTLRGDDFPSFSPDGNQIVFSSTNASRGSRVGAGEVFLINKNGTGLSAITHNAANDFDPVIGDITDTTPSATTGAVISEFRTSGPGGSTDEFIEIYNQGNTLLNVSGWTVTSGTVTATLTKPIPAYGRFLLTGSGYTLANLGGPNAAMGDNSYPGDIADNATLTLRNGAGTAVDVVNASSLPALTSFSTDYSYVRRMDGVGAAPLDTNSDTNDFNLVDVSSTIGPNNATGVSNCLLRLGAPGPQNLASPTTANQFISFVPASPASVRVGSGNSGTLALRYVVTNRAETGRTFTALRFRFVALTAGATAIATDGTNSNGPADLRAISSTSGGGTILPLQLQTPPNQPNGGALNSSLSLANLPGGGLAPGASITVEMLFNVVQRGQYRFAVNFEPVTAP